MWRWLSFLRLPLAYIQNKGDFFILWCPGSNNEQTLHNETVLWEKHEVWPLCRSEEWWWWYPHNIAFSIDEFGTHFLTYNFTEFFCFFFPLLKSLETILWGSPPLRTDFLVFWEFLGILKNSPLCKWPLQTEFPVFWKFLEIPGNSWEFLGIPGNS